MNGGGSQDARALESVTQGRFADKLPRRNVEAEAINAWRAVDTLSTADAADLRDNMTALVEMRDKINAMIEGSE